MLSRRHKLLVFQDSVGITEGYRGLWTALLNRSGLGEDVVQTILRSAYSKFPKNHLLEWQKKRKQPGFQTNPLKQRATRQFVEETLEQHNPDFVVCMDPALLFLFNSDWGQATLDRLRGGVYIFCDKPCIVTLPVTAFHTKMKQADIAKLNEGYTEKADFEEYRESEDGDEPDDEDTEDTMEWHEPITVPYGKAVLDFDFAKVARIMGRIPV